MIFIKFEWLNWIQTLIQRFFKIIFQIFTFFFYIFTNFLIYLHHQIMPKLNNKLKIVFYFWFFYWQQYESHTPSVVDFLGRGGHAAAHPAWTRLTDGQRCEKAPPRSHCSVLEAVKGREVAAQLCIYMLMCAGSWYKPAGTTHTVWPSSPLPQSTFSRLAEVNAKSGSTSGVCVGHDRHLWKKLVRRSPR